MKPGTYIQATSKTGLRISGKIIELTPRGYKVREANEMIAHIDVKLFAKEVKI